MTSRQMKRLKAWMILMLQGPAKSSPPEGVDGQLRVDHPDRWKVGDEIVTVHSEAGTVVISKSTAEHMGIQGKPGRITE